MVHSAHHAATAQQTASKYRYRAFGLTWESSLILPYYSPTDVDRNSDVTVLRVARPGVRRLLGRAGARTICEDGVRFAHPGEPVIDIFRDRIELARHSGNAPAPLRLFGSATAALLALRGFIPMHGTAVEIDGQAILICGAAGTGKSTLGAALIGAGARLISDDLSALCPNAAEAPLLVAGRRSMRLHARAVPLLKVSPDAILGRHGRKYLVAPPHVSTSVGLRLARIVILGKDAFPSPAGSVAQLMKQMFRPVLLRALPGHWARLETLMKAAGQIDLIRMQAPGESEIAAYQRLARSTSDELSRVAR